MFIFETENRIKLSSDSLNTGQINHPITFLFKKPIARLKFSFNTSSLGVPERNGKGKSL